MTNIYEGFYTRFNTASKKEAAVLLGADCLVGDQFEIEFKTERGLTVAWMKNRFGAYIGYFDTNTSRRLHLFKAREWEIRALLSFVAFTDKPNPGHYWGEVAILSYDPIHQDVFEKFLLGTATRLMDGIRPLIDLGEQGVSQVISTNGSWTPTKTVPMPTKESGTAVIKSKRKVSEKLIEQGRKGNKGCYFISWLFLLGFVAAILFTLKSCGVV